VPDKDPPNLSSYTSEQESAGIGTSTLGSRLVEIRQSQPGRLSQADFAKTVGVGRTTQLRYESGEREPDVPYIRAVCEVYQICSEWLLNGTGPKHPGSAAVVEGELVRVPQYDVVASMGPGALNGEEAIIDHWPMSVDHLRSLGVTAADAIIIATRGDSMSPTLEDGDRVLIDRGKRKQTSSGIYVLRLGDELFAKRLQWKTDGSLLVKSDNAAYDTEEVARDAAKGLYIVGRVSARIGRL